MRWYVIFAEGSKRWMIMEIITKDYHMPTHFIFTTKEKAEKFLKEELNG